MGWQLKSSAPEPPTPVAQFVYHRHSDDAGIEVTAHKIEAHRITKPIQLLAAWIIGLILTDSIFLYSAVSFEPRTWERGILVIAAILNVPGFLFALFLLQTKFRAELQEDTYYHEYINKKTATPQHLDKDFFQDSRIERLENLIKTALTQDMTLQQPIDIEDLDWEDWPIAINSKHPQYGEICQAMQDSSIPISSVFGNGTSLKPPAKWIIAINPAMPFQMKIHLFKVLVEFDFDGYELHLPVREAEEEEDIYIGCYGFTEYCKIDYKFKRLIKDDAEEKDFDKHYKLNQI